MKKKYVIGLLLLVAAFSGCKQNDWLDWKAQNELWLIENGKKEGVITTPTGLQYEVIQSGPSTGYPIRPDDSKVVTISYKGSLINGYEFDSSDSYTAYTTAFVDGFIEGLKRMKQFDTYRFYIPWELGYGSKGNSVAEGNSSYIPPYTTLIFEVTLESVN